ncbi:murein transglycosylase A [Escherichia coli]|uniref:murein transglycosylase A n=1 Tax=Escherichia coli TaxID=562 RepID=UPI00244C8E5B|nr:murein transglycosylase A [Escherichia coli]
MTTMNPFLVQSTLPYLAPHFDQIANHHYRPAFDEGMQQKRAEIAAIALNPQMPDFNNTILALEQSGELLTRVTSVFFAMTAAHTNDELQRLDEQFSAELAELANDIYLNGELFARVDAVWQRRESLGLDSESIRLVEVIHQRFVLAGAKLAQADKAKLKVLNTEAATLTSQFNQRLLAANKSGGLVVNDIAQLAGMSEQEIALAAEAAREKGLDNKWLIPLLNTTQQPALAEMRDRATREKLFAEIYAGALSDKYILAYSNSLMDNFIMDVQGSGYIDFGDGSPLNFFSYAGKNGHAYRSIGKVLIDRGEVKKEDMSMQAIRHWGETHSEAEVRELLEQNPSFVFFKPQSFAPVKGASAVPLVGRASVASDRSIIPPGTTLLAEVPLLDNNGKFNGQYELRLMVALDVGGAIKGQHFDIYQGIGPEAGHRAGWYNHYGRVWVLKTAPGAGNVFSG